MRNYGSPVCWSCDKKYSRDSQNVPRILSCSHAFCEGCVQRFWKRGYITCPECDEKQELSNIRDIKNKIPIHTHIFGILCAPRLKENAVDSTIHHQLYRSSKPQVSSWNMLDEEEDVDDCAFPSCAECQQKSDLYCKDCCLYYCEHCSGEVHRIVALRNHKPACINEADHMFTECPEHPEAIPTHYLVSTGEPICPECPQEGEVLPLLLDNKNIEEILQKCNSSLQAINVTESTINTIARSIEEDSNRIKGSIRRSMAFAHGLLQTREETLLKLVEERLSERIAALNDIRYSLDKANFLIKKNSDWLEKNQTRPMVLAKSQLKLAKIKKESMEVKTCLIIDSKCRPTYEEHRDVLRSSIAEFGDVKIDNVHMYRLDKNSSEEIAELDPVSSEVELGQDARSCPQVDITPLPNTVIETNKLENGEKVYVSHCETPYSFYVQRDKDKDVIAEITDKLDKFYGLTTTDEDALTGVAPDDFVCCQFSEDELWYRARVVSNVATKDDSLGDSDDSVTVIYVDFGNTETVKLSSLRQLKAEFAHFPQQAIHCSLYDIEPRDSPTWTSDQNNTFKHLTLDRSPEFTIALEETSTDGITKVDLINEEGDSIKKYLVLLQNACYPSSASPTSSVRRVDASTGIVTIQMKPMQLGWVYTEDDFQQVRISYAYGPDDFYIQFGSSSEIILEMKQQIDAYVDNHARRLDNIALGTLCLARYSADDGVYRAVITDISGVNIKLFFCDYGNYEYVHNTDVYDIPDHIAQYPQQAINCGLYGIQPMGHEWNEESKKAICRLVQQQECYYAKSEEQVHEKHLVTLVDTQQGETDVYISYELVRLGLATAIQDSPVDVLGTSCSLGNVGQTVKVDLSHIESPSSIYVIPSNTYQPLLEKLSAVYTPLVQSNSPALYNTDWKVGDYCVTNKDNFFIRGKIISFISSEKVKIENIDRGKILKKATTDIYVITEEFQVLPRCSVRCKLWDIEPIDEAQAPATPLNDSIDSSSTRSERDKNGNVKGSPWPHQIVKVCTNYIKQFGDSTFYLTIKGSPDSEGVLPVDLTITKRGTNDPERLSQYLVSCHYAQQLKEKRPVYASRSDLPNSQLSCAVTNVSKDCLIYISLDMEEEAKKKVQTELSQLERADLPANAGVYWVEGDVCVLEGKDGRFKRGLIEKRMGHPLIQVYLIDVGISEQINSSFVYPFAVCPDVPPLALVCKIANLLPSWYSGGVVWPISASRVLYESLVNEKCLVDIVNHNDPLEIAIIRVDGLDVAAQLIEKNLAVSCNFNSV